MKRRRSILKVIALLLVGGGWLVAGAALNVAVAWGHYQVGAKARPHPSFGSDCYGLPFIMLDRAWGGTSFDIF